MSGDEIGQGYVFPVWPHQEVRGSLSSILARFAEEGPLSPPVILGRHRKPEAALIPYRLLARLLAVYEEQQGPQLLARSFEEQAASADRDFLPRDDLA